MTKAFTAATIFTGEKFVYDHCILTSDGKITEVLPASIVPDDVPVLSFGQHTIVPAFIDLQIYGAGGKLLSIYPETEALQRLYNYCYEGGAHHFLPTVATNEYDVFYRCIDAIRQYWQQQGKGVLGLHIEGPWISEEKRGAHIKSLIHSPTLQHVTNLLEYGKGVIKMITLAPEVCSRQVVDLIASYGVVVSAGHSNATYDQAVHAFNNGISTATHLYNAMSALNHRQPGMVGAILNHKAARSSIIPDGHHVDYAAISIAKKVMGERLYMITDAVTETDSGPYPHVLEGDKYVSNGILSGSALTMLKGVKNLIEHAGVEKQEAFKMASLYPAKILGIQQQAGSIQTGCLTDWLVLDNNLDIVDHVTSGGTL